MQPNRIIRILIAVIGVFVTGSLMLQMYRFYRTPGTPRRVVPHMAVALAVILLVMAAVFYAIGSRGGK